MCELLRALPAHISTLLVNVKLKTHLLLFTSTLYTVSHTLKYIFYSSSGVTDKTALVNMALCCTLSERRTRSGGSPGGM